MKQKILAIDPTYQAARNKQMRAAVEKIANLGAEFLEGIDPDAILADLLTDKAKSDTGGNRT